MKHISIGEAAVILGLSVVTLRRWDRYGLLKPIFRTFGNHRRYNLDDILKLFKKDFNIKKVIGYSRVSTFDQKKDLKVQSEVLSNYIKDKYEDFEIIEDLGSGLNYKKRGLRRLIKMICNREISVLVLTHKDRLLRFGSEIIIQLCERFDIKVDIINYVEEETFEQTLCNDVLSIITVFSAKLHGKRSHKNKKILKNIC
jgi:predicted site-specific integrase-resolvase